MKAPSHRFQSNEPPAADGHADVKTLLVALACLAAAALETCGEMRHRARHVDSAASLTATAYIGGEALPSSRSTIRVVHR